MSSRISALTVTLTFSPLPCPLLCPSPLSPIDSQKSLLSFHGFKAKHLSQRNESPILTSFLEARVNSLVDLFSHRKNLRNKKLFSHVSAIDHASFLTYAAHHILLKNHKIASLANWQREFVRTCAQNQVAIVQRTPSDCLHLIPIESLRKMLTMHLDLLDDRTAKRIAHLYNTQELAILFAQIPMHQSLRFIQLVRELIKPSNNPSNQESLLFICCFPKLSDLKVNQKPTTFQRIVQCSEDELIYTALYDYIYKSGEDNAQAQVVSYLEHLSLLCARRMIHIVAEKNLDMLSSWIHHTRPTSPLFGYIIKEFPLEQQRLLLFDRNLHPQEISRALYVFSQELLISLIGIDPLALEPDSLQRQLPFLTDVQIIAIAHCRSFDSLIQKLLFAFPDKALELFAYACPCPKLLSSLIELAVKKQAPSSLIPILEGIQGQLTQSQIIEKLEPFFTEFLPILKKTIELTTKEIDGYFSATYQLENACEHVYAKLKPAISDTTPSIDHRWKAANLAARKFIELSHCYSEIIHLNLSVFLPSSRRRRFCSELDSARSSVKKTAKLCHRLWKEGSELQQARVRSQTHAPSTTMQWLEQLHDHSIAPVFKNSDSNKTSRAQSQLASDIDLHQAHTPRLSEEPSSDQVVLEQKEQDAANSFGKKILDIYQNLKLALQELGITPERLDELELSWEDLLEVGLRGENLKIHQIASEKDLLLFLASKKK